MKRLLFVLPVLALTACGDHSSSQTMFSSDIGEVVIIDKCMQREIFNQCMKTLPEGPKATKYNDWDEVVAECRHSGYYMSARKRKFVKPECQGE
jgi:hypothetical protein